MTNKQTEIDSMHKLVAMRIAGVRCAEVVVLGGNS
jgi:hypothetical protein